MSAVVSQSSAAGRARRGISLSGSDIAPIAVAVVTLIAFVLRLTQLHQSLYGDEVWTFQDLQGRGLGAVLQNVHSGAENSPPLFFAMAWLFAKIGDPTVWIRVPSLLLGTATIPLIYRLGTGTVGRGAGAIAAAVLAFSPFSIYYGIEARPYATMLFFLTLSTLALVRAVRTGTAGWWALYAVAAAAAAYSHYTSVFVLAAQGLWSLWVCRERISRPLTANAAIAILYLPWLGHIRGKSLGVIGLLEPLNVHNVISDLVRPLAGYPYAGVDSIPTFPGLAALVLAALAGAVALARRTTSRRELPPRFGLLLALALATPVGLLLYSMIGTDLWLARNLYASAPAMALVLGALLAALDRRAMAVALAAVLITLILGTMRAVSPSLARPPFRTVAELIDRSAHPGDAVIMFPSFVDQAVQAQVHKGIRVLNASPEAWGSVAPEHQVFAILDDRTAQTLGKTAAPSRPGFRLVARRHYEGLIWFSLLVYRRA